MFYLYVPDKKSTNSPYNNQVPLIATQVSSPGVTTIVGATGLPKTVTKQTVILTYQPQQYAAQVNSYYNPYVKFLSKGVLFTADSSPNGYLAFRGEILKELLKYAIPTVYTLLVVMDAENPNHMNVPQSALIKLCQLN